MQVSQGSLLTGADFATATDYQQTGLHKSEMFCRSLVKAGEDWGAIYGFEGPPEKGQTWMDATFRYMLWRVWDSALPNLVVCGLNPSTASHIENDPTIRRCINFAHRWGYGGLVMLNIFAYRATQPVTLYHLQPTKNGHHGGIGPRNHVHLRWWSQPLNRAGKVLIGWGDHGALAKRGVEAARTLAAIQPVYALAVNQNGQPRHPLYVSGHVVPEIYPIQ